MKHIARNELLDLTKMLVDRQRVSRTDAALHARLDSQQMLEIASRMYVDRESFGYLKRYQQEYLRCYAAGQSVRRAVLVGRSAARVQGMWVMNTPEEKVELVLPGGRPSSKSRWFEGHTWTQMPLATEDVGVVDGVRCTTPLRTAVDIARLHGYDHGLVAFDWLFSGLNREESREVWHALSRMTKRLSGTRGVGNARLLLENPSALSESAMEAIVRAVLLRHNIQYEQQVLIDGYRVDFLILNRLILEIDGYAKFGDQPHGVVLRQLKRENYLRAKGYPVFRLFSDQVRDERWWIPQVLRMAEAPEVTLAPQW